MVIDYTESPFVYIAEHSLTTSLQYTLPLDASVGEVSLMGSVDWLGVMDSRLDLAAFVDNAADEEYVTGGLNVPDTLGRAAANYGPPRTYPLAVDGVLYFSGSYSGVYAVDGSSGKLLWKYDPGILRACIPGCQGLEKVADDRFTATVEVKVGPIGARFKGAVSLADLDPPYGYTLIPYELQAQVGGAWPSSAPRSPYRRCPRLR